MINKRDLIELGFNEYPCVFSDDIVWTLGYRCVDLYGDSCKFPIFYYVMDMQILTIITSGFCNMTRNIKTREEIIKFIKYYNQLFNLQVCVS